MVLLKEIGSHLFPLAIFKSIIRRS